ncbi:DUF537-domain-containing protein [Phlegmacium glaucopus]|nr:DUF537-domain-containing protein [Phlegmacium glaucopus]
MEVAVFWDYENCPSPTNASGYAIVNNIRSIVQTFGSIKLFKAYLEVIEQVPVSRAAVLRSELQSSGVSLTDCPRNGRKDVADKMIIVDMLAHAIDNPAPSTIVLISCDRIFAYALSILRLRCYRIILITLSNAHPSLRAQASLCFDWLSDVVDSTSSYQPPSPRRRKTSSAPAQDKFYSDYKGHNVLRSPFQESYDERYPSNIQSMSYFQDETRRRDDSRMPPKHDPGRDFLPPHLQQSERQPVVSSVASSTLCSAPERGPVASSCLNGSIETPLTMSALDSNSSQTTLTPNTSTGSTPKLTTCGSIVPSKSSAHSTLRGSDLPNLTQHQVANVTEAVSFDSAMRVVLPAEPDPSPQQGAYSLINAQTQNLSSLDQMYDSDSDPDSPPARSDISPPLNITRPPSTFLPSSINATASANAESTVKADHPLQPPSFPPIPDKFKILIRCLKSHRSKGSLRPLRSLIGLEIANNGTTYRQAGVMNFSQYVAMAAKAGVIELGGSDGTSWVALRAPW